MAGMKKLLSRPLMAPTRSSQNLPKTAGAQEQVFFQTKDKKLLPLPTVNSLLKADGDFKLRLWIVSATLDDNKSDIKCNGDNAVTIGFWGGGNCRGCERTVIYTFDKNGQFKNAKFK